MRTADFFYQLPPELIAQTPAVRRDGSRLLVLHRSEGRIEHRQFPDLTGYLQAGDVLVLNNSRVIPARLRGTNLQTGGRFEMLLLEEAAVNDWWVLLKPGKRARSGTRIGILDLKGGTTGLSATVAEVNAEGHRRLTFTGTPDVRHNLDSVGEIPLPPYIVRPRYEPENAGVGHHRPAPDTLDGQSGSLSHVLPEAEDDNVRYQTVYADPPGSVAAPTAGLHFTPEILEKIRAQGVIVCFVTLHVGIGTFAPVKAELLEGHAMHEEWMEIGAETVNAIQTAKAAGHRVIAAGTTSVRVLESVAALNNGAVRVHRGKTRIFIHPPYHFQVADALLTNFHLPCSTLLMLVSAFASPGLTNGREMMLNAYEEAIRNRYRFFSYGDAMLIW